MHRTFDTYTDRTITDPTTLRAELEKVRATGYALNDEESRHGVRTLAVPVLVNREQARFALAMRSTPQTLTDDRLAWFASRGRACARTLAVLLLGPGERPEPDDD